MLRSIAAGGVLVWLALSGLPLYSQTASAPPSWTVTGGDVQVRCSLTVGGSFNAETSALEGQLSVTESNAAVFDGDLSVDLSGLDTGISLRNNHLRSTYLEVERGAGFDRAVLSGIRLDEALPSGGGRHETGFSGTLLLHGVERIVTGEAELNQADGGTEVEATFAVSLDAFEIPPPRYLGIGVRDEVDVTIAFTASAR